MRLFLDANVLFSAAHNPDGRARALFTLQARGACQLIASAHAIEEARRNIALKYPRLLAELEQLLAEVFIVGEPSADRVLRAREVGLPADDAPILAAALSAQAAFLVTGDRSHFGPLYGKAVEGTVVVPPADALSRLLEL
jgi:predicted nucleic acid-binding protein